MPTPTACRPFKPAEVPKLMEAFDSRYADRNRALLSLGICTGFRISELLSLTIEDVYERGEIKDTIRIPKRMMKGKRSRSPKKIYPEAKEYLNKWINYMRMNMQTSTRSWLFASHKGGVIGPVTCYQIINDAARKAGISTEGVGTHSMRKTFANAVYDYWDEQQRAGERIEPMRMTQIELGHASIEDTYSYMEFKMEDKPDTVFAKYNLPSTETK